MVGAEDGRTDGLAGASMARRDDNGRRLAPASPLSMQTQPKERSGSGSSHNANNNHDDNNSSEFSHYFLVAAAAASAQAEAARTASCLPLSPSPHSTTSSNADMLGTAAKPALPSISSSPPLPYLEEKTPFPLSLGSSAFVLSVSPPTPSGKRKPRVGKLRCCWAILSTTLEIGRTPLRFMYVDPMFGIHLSSQASALIDTSFFDYIHPEDRERTEVDMKNIISSRTLFGSVTRCRYSRMHRMRSMLGAADMNSSEGEYLPIDIVLNWIGADMALCFFHAIMDESEKDNDETNKSEWSNWCGTQPGSFDPHECQKVWQSIRSHRALRASATGPDHVFQILSSPSTPSSSPSDVFFSWPPPRLIPGPSNDTHGASSVNFADGSYSVDDFARLAQGVSPLTLRKELSDANTSCTRRFRAKHTLTSESMVRSVESVLIPYGSIVLACFSVTYTQLLPGASSALVATTKAPAPTPAYAPASAFSHLFETLPPPVTKEQPVSPNVQQPWQSMQLKPSRTSLLNASMSASQKDKQSKTGDETGGSVATLAAVAAAAAAQTKSCASCGTSNSPEWRKGPDGTKSLCNACGLRFSRNISRARKREERARLAAEVAANGGIIPPHLRKKPGADIKKPKKRKRTNGEGNADRMPTEPSSEAAGTDDHSTQLARAAAQAAAAAGLRPS